MRKFLNFSSDLKRIKNRHKWEYRPIWAMFGTFLIRVRVGKNERR